MLDLELEDNALELELEGAYDIPEDQVPQTSKLLYNNFVGVNPNDLLKHSEILSALLVNKYKIPESNFNILASGNIPEQSLELAEQTRIAFVNSNDIKSKSKMSYTKYLYEDFTQLTHVANEMADKLIDAEHLAMLEARNKLNISTQHYNQLREKLKNTSTDTPKGIQHATDIQKMLSDVEREVFRCKNATLEHALRYKKIKDFMDRLVRLYKVLLTPLPNQNIKLCIVDLMLMRNVKIMNNISIEPTTVTVPCECGKRITVNHEDIGCLNYSQSTIRYTLQDLVTKICEVYENIPKYISSAELALVEPSVLNTPLAEDYRRLTNDTDRRKFISANTSQLKLDADKIAYLRYLQQLSSFVVNAHHGLLMFLYINPDEPIPNALQQYSNTCHKECDVLKSHPLLKGGEGDVLNSSMTSAIYQNTPKEELVKVARNNLEHLIDYNFDMGVSAKSSVRKKYGLLKCPNCNSTLILPSPVTDTIDTVFNQVCSNLIKTKNSYITFINALTPCVKPLSKTYDIKKSDGKGYWRMMKKQQDQRKTSHSEHNYLRSTGTLKTANMVAVNQALVDVKVRYNLCNDELASRMLEAEQIGDQVTIQQILNENNRLRETYNSQVYSTYNNESDVNAQEPVLEDDLSQYGMPNIPTNVTTISTQSMESSTQDASTETTDAYADNCTVQDMFKRDKLAEYGDVDLETLSFEELTSKGFYTLESLQHYYDNYQYDEIVEFLAKVVKNDGMWESIPEVLKEAVENEYVYSDPTREMLDDFFDM